MSLRVLAIVLKYMKASKARHANDMMNGTGLVLVNFSTVLLIISANVIIQITVVVGILDGIAGFLFETIRSSQPASSGPKNANPTQGKKLILS